MMPMAQDVVVSTAGGTQDVVVQGGKKGGIGGGCRGLHSD